MNLSRHSPERFVLLYQDEGTFYRQPSQSWLWAQGGRRQPRMRYSHRKNTRVRVVGYLEASNAAVHTEQMRAVTARNLARSVSLIPEQYPAAEKIFLVWDSWPVHRHEKVKAALSKDPRLSVLPLPTYAPWLNPMEKVWRWGRQTLSHAHPWCDDFGEFLQQLSTQFGTLSQGSAELLRYVGLST